ncbi:hypothetical protein MBLNU459_g8107t1 [Dothideomycetes sp. NU459]
MESLRERYPILFQGTTLWIILAVGFVGLLLYRVTLHPLARVPGPFLAKFTGMWRNYYYLKGNWHEDILGLHRKYGRVVRIAPNELSLVDEAAMRQLYGHGTSAPKTSWYSVWDVPNTGPGLFATTSFKTHSFLRRRVAGAYSMSSLLKLERYIQDCLDLLLQQLKKHADLGETVNMSNWTNAFAFDVVGELAYGEALGHLQTETDVMDVRKGIFTVFKMSSNLGHIPGQNRLVNNPFNTWVTSTLGLPNPFTSFQNWSISKVRQRREGKSEASRQDMLQHFIQMKGADGNPASEGEVLIEAMNIIGAGADTTSIGMRTCLYYICNNPDVYKRLQQEVDDYYTNNNLEAPITYTQTQQMPYLQAVVKEATRLLPSIVYQLLRHVPAGGMTVDNRFIPAGTPVGISPMAQNRDQAIWGTDADLFRPDRWLEDETRSKYLDTNNMTFGGNGPRMCVGRNIALVEMHKFVAQLLRNFDVDFVDREKPWHITSYWFAYQHDMEMHIKARPDRVLRRV